MNSSSASIWSAIDLLLLTSAKKLKTGIEQLRIACAKVTGGVSRSFCFAMREGRQDPMISQVSDNSFDRASAIKDINGIGSRASGDIEDVNEVDLNKSERA